MPWRTRRAGVRREVRRLVRWQDGDLGQVDVPGHYFRHHGSGTLLGAPEYGPRDRYTVGDAVMGLRVCRIRLGRGWIWLIPQYVNNRQCGRSKTGSRSPSPRLTPSGRSLRRSAPFTIASMAGLFVTSCPSSSNATPAKNWLRETDNRHADRCPRRGPRPGSRSSILDTGGVILHRRLCGAHRCRCRLACGWVSCFAASCEDVATGRSKSSDLEPVRSRVRVSVEFWTSGRWTRTRGVRLTR
jgi:hypothetical protein